MLITEIGLINMLKYLTTVLVGGTLIGSAAVRIFDPAKKLRAKEQNILSAANMLKNLSVTCRCGGLAIPTEQRGKIRRCTRCNTQFSSSAYNLGDTRTAYKRNNSFFVYERLDMQYYDDAVQLLKEEDKAQR